MEVAFPQAVDAEGIPNASASDATAASPSPSPSIPFPHYILGGTTKFARSLTRQSPCCLECILQYEEGAGLCGTSSACSQTSFPHMCRFVLVALLVLVLLLPSVSCTVPLQVLHPRARSFASTVTTQMDCSGCAAFDRFQVSVFPLSPTAAALLMPNVHTTASSPTVFTSPYPVADVLPVCAPTINEPRSITDRLQKGHCLEL
ncbi:hypothetical protein EXIGLDRAFT_217476 [Exidia glandulosa HHB12029]|uniref:Uncharacterized protein n=1 Tax=Exidia glandulosa HHB12029 TaxID=1314781 RepID=A0A165EEP7_EXIGL|nr:hypothetical protein EXIGLDRAFT_217476 [Exidia glandulosa HHB12029]